MKTYTHKEFINDYKDHIQKKGNTISDLTLEEKEMFVTWCRKCGKGATRQNVKYSVFCDKQTQPLCFDCRQQKSNSDMTSKQKLFLITLIEKKFLNEEQRNFYYKMIVGLTKRQASDLIQKLGYKSKQKVTCHKVSCME